MPTPKNGQTQNNPLAVNERQNTLATGHQHTDFFFFRATVQPILNKEIIIIIIIIITNTAYNFNLKKVKDMVPYSRLLRGRRNSRITGNIM